MKYVQQHIALSRKTCMKEVKNLTKTITKKVCHLYTTTFKKVWLHNFACNLHKLLTGLTHLHTKFLIITAIGWTREPPVTHQQQLNKLNKQVQSTVHI